MAVLDKLKNTIWQSRGCHQGGKYQTFDCQDMEAEIAKLVVGQDLQTNAELRGKRHCRDNRSEKGCRGSPRPGRYASGAVMSGNSLKTASMVCKTFI